MIVRQLREREELIEDILVNIMLLLIEYYSSISMSCVYIVIDITDVDDQKNSCYLINTTYIGFVNLIYQSY